MPRNKQTIEQTVALPHQSQQLEIEVIGILLSEPTSFETAHELIKPSDFYVEAHRMILEAIYDLHAKGMYPDILMVAEELRKRGQLDACGGVYFLTKSTNTFTGSYKLESYCLILLQLSVLRSLQTLTGELHNKSNQKDADAFDLLDEMENRVFEISNMIHKSEVNDLSDVLVDVLKRIEFIKNNPQELTGVPSGFVLDKITNGWQKSDLIILAARPSVGKTAFALNLARNAAAHKTMATPVLIFSLEMSKTQLTTRMLSNESGVLLSKILSGYLTEDEMKFLHLKGASALAEYKIFIDDKAGITLNEIKSKSKRMVSKFGVGLIIIDYLQLIDAGLKNNSNREQQISHISRTLKKLAKECNVPVIALSQLSRSVDERSDKEPKLSDLRESGAIEQDADIVLFIYRPSKEDIQRDPALANKGMIKIAKHRNGALYDGVFNFFPETQTWDDDINDSFVPFKPVEEKKPISDLPF